MTISRILLGTALAAMTATPSLADKANDTVNFAFAYSLETPDVYFNTAREGLLLNLSVWDGLLYRNPETGAFEGNLATSWEWLDPTTIEFKLREGVKFHNGEPFNADDVVYTVNYITNPENGVKNVANVSWMDHAEKVDDFTVKLYLKAPFPAAEEYLAGPVAIYPDEYYAKVGPEGMATAPVGTGPYKITSVTPAEHWVLEKNDAYFDGPKAKAKVGKIDIRNISEMNTQIAEMFNGTLDFIWKVPADQFDKLASMGKYSTMNAPSMRIGYLSMDATGRTGDSPLTNEKVRQAIYHAVDRQAIVKALVKGASQVVNSPCAPNQFACDNSLEGYAYDPAKAKELLTEAGYPDGFSIDFYAYRDRPYAEAIMGFLSEVGIKANLQFMKYAALRELHRKGEAPFVFLTWGSNSVADASAITGEFFTGGLQDDARDEEVINWIKEADTLVDKEKRQMLYSKAETKIIDEAYWVPLWTYDITYVTNPDLDFTPTDDEIVRFYDFAWK